MSRPIFGSADAEQRAERALPRILFDYIEGGAGAEDTCRRNPAAFSELTFAPRMASGITQPQVSATVLGQALSAPLLLAPVGGVNLVHPDGQIGGSRAAGERGLVAAVSTYAGSELADAAQRCGPPSWFQLYKIGGRKGAEWVLAEARRGRYDTLVVTIDTPVVGKKERELRHLGHRQGGLTLQSMAASAFAFFAPKVLTRPRWTCRFVRAGFPLGNPTIARMPATVAADFAAANHAWLAEPFTWSDLEWLREQWDGPIVLKGIMTGADARRGIAGGADGLIVSNHGGRQLDGLPASIAVLPEVVAEAGTDVEVLIDGGVRRGADIAKALALGANAVMIGRPWVYALACAGEQGVGQLLDSLIAELRETLVLLGCPDVAALDTSYLR